MELDARHAFVPKIFAQHYTLDSADAFPAQLNMLGWAPNACEPLHIARNFFCGPGSLVVAAALYYSNVAWSGG